MPSRLSMSALCAVTITFATAHAHAQRAAMCTTADNTSFAAAESVIPNSREMRGICAGETQFFEAPIASDCELTITATGDTASISVGLYDWRHELVPRTTRSIEPGITLAPGEPDVYWIAVTGGTGGTYVLDVREQCTGVVDSVVDAPLGFAVAAVAVWVCEAPYDDCLSNAREIVLGGSLWRETRAAGRYASFDDFIRAQADPEAALATTLWWTLVEHFWWQGDGVPAAACIGRDCPAGQLCNPRTGTCQSEASGSGPLRGASACDSRNAGVGATALGACIVPGMVNPPGVVDPVWSATEAAIAEEFGAAGPAEGAFGSPGGPCEGLNPAFVLGVAGTLDPSDFNDLPRWIAPDQLGDFFALFNYRMEHDVPKAEGKPEKRWIQSTIKQQKAIYKKRKTETDSKDGEPEPGDEAPADPQGDGGGGAGYSLDDTRDICRRIVDDHFTTCMFGDDTPAGSPGTLICDAQPDVDCAPDEPSCGRPWTCGCQRGDGAVCTAGYDATALRSLTSIYYTTLPHADTCASPSPSVVAPGGGECPRKCLLAVAAASVRVGIPGGDGIEPPVWGDDCSSCRAQPSDYSSQNWVESLCAYNDVPALQQLCFAVDPLQSLRVGWRAVAAASRLDATPRGLAAISVGDYAGGFDQYESEYYDFELDRETTMDISTTGAGGCPGDTVIELIGASGATIMVDDDGGEGLCSHLSASLGPGAYRLRVRGYAMRAVPAYELRMTHELPIIDAQRFAGGFGYGGEDRHTLAAEPGQRVLLETSDDAGTGCPGDTMIFVYAVDDAGHRTLLASDDDSGIGLCSRLEVEVPGAMIEVAVRGYASRGVADYRLAATAR